MWCRDFLPGHQVIHISCLKLRSPESEKPIPWQSLTRTVDPLRVLNSLLLRTSPPAPLSSSRCHLSSGSQAGRPGPPLLERQPSTISHLCCRLVKSCPTLAMLQTVAHQAPLSIGFPRQEYWRQLPFPSPGDLPDPGIEPASPALAGGFFTMEPLRKPHLWLGWAPKRIQAVATKLSFRPSSCTWVLE